ncbi:TraB/GumN family protein [Diaphorobacter ruginosibacter]|uniref:TraB/GumN family protein n=1 Tax=Diaphorobacter ruginosibacter TaxID=1715720 RepID=A0A7G9RQ46_9BURK|nr:TraB/GumN family protein [Diaphorobacter ruginosibacter]QNN57721.1 TraB/GumN family protein [Diaphorobacter ruginosibacter]
MVLGKALQGCDRPAPAYGPGRLRRWARAARQAVVPALLSAGLSLVIVPGAARAEGAGCPPAAQMPDQATLQSLMRNARDRGVLWRLEKDGRTSWLYGTIHVAEQAWMVPGPLVMDALRSADALALELNLLDPAVMEQLLSAMRTQPGAKPLPQPLQERLQALKERECVGTQIDALRPDAQVVSLATLIARREGLDPSYGIDLTLGGVATGMRKPVIGLESVQTQIRQMISDDPKQVEETVRTGLAQLEREDAGTTLSLLAHAWADGRMNLLESYPTWCRCLTDAAEKREYERMVVGRNPGMARAIGREIASGRNLFVAVGALHMAGRDALPKLLEQQGFHVTRVEFPGNDPSGMPASH